jgi:hypothetical protein
MEELHSATQVRTTPAHHTQSLRADHPALGHASGHGHGHGPMSHGHPSMRESFPTHAERERFERAPASAGGVGRASTQRPTLQSEEGAPVPTRRAPARELGASGRDRASFVPPLDADWDTPAFQRRGN